jgi:hypothetical protein
MRERRIAAEHAAAMGVHHAATDRVVDLESDLVKSLKQNNHVPSDQAASLAWFARLGDEFEASINATIRQSVLMLWRIGLWPDVVPGPSRVTDA